MENIPKHLADLPPRKRALLLWKLKEQQGGIPPNRIVPGEERRPCRALSSAQQRLWFLDRLTPGDPAYNVPLALRLSGRLDVRSLEQSLREIVRRHGILRTIIEVVNDSPVQVQLPGSPNPLEVAEAAGSTPAARMDAALQIAAEEVRRPFLLGKNPPLRAKLLRLDEEDHLLVVTMHHIACDGCSVGIFTKELAALYDAFSRGNPSPLARLPIQYADFAEWQRTRLDDGASQQLLDYWKPMLADLSELSLPFDRPRPAVRTSAGAIVSRALSASLCRDLRELSRSHGVTLFVTLLSAFKALLYRYTWEVDITVGTVTTSRRRVELEGLIGFFVNTLVLRTDLSGQPGFRELLQRVNEVVLGAFAHDDLPFEKLVEALDPVRDLRRTPLIQVMFALDTLELGAMRSSGLRMLPITVETNTAKFDLSLWVKPHENALQTRLEYSTTLFDRATVRQMQRHYHQLLESIVSTPDRKLMNLRLSTTAEAAQQVTNCSNTTTETLQAVCVHHAFEAQVRRAPHATALSFESTYLTYAKLNALANQLARFLMKQAIGPETLVGVCMHRGPAMVVAILGVLKAGAAYVPLDPADPEARSRYMIEDSGIALLLTQDDLRERLPACSVSQICVDLERERIAAQPQSNVEGGTLPENLAYVIYTSGSTGKPKGVQVEHATLCNLAQAGRAVFGVDETSRVLQFASLIFDASIWEVLFALLSGGTLCLSRRESVLPGRTSIELIRDEAITLAVLPPSVLATMPVEHLPALQTIIAGGELCDHEVVARWAPKRRFWNAYGPTEATVCTTAGACTEGDTKPPIGRPIPNVCVYVLDPSRQAVPIGVAAELCIGGKGVARGYLRRPALTAERFVPDPFSSRPGERMYKSGDLARYRRDGNLEFVGRADDQVKIRGFRVELGEIEAALMRHPGVRHTVVITRGRRSEEMQLIAYLKGEQSASTLALRRFLKTTLPDYMIPNQIVQVEQFPRTRSGKIDRQALRQIPVATCNARTTVSPPCTTSTERVIAEVWAEILGVSSIGVQDSFFDLGGQSLQSVIAAGRLEARLHVTLTPRELFVQTLGQLAASIDAFSGKAQRAMKGRPRSNSLPDSHELT